MGRTTVFTSEVELYDLDESFTVQMQPLDADGKVDDTTDRYAWVITLTGDGTIHIWRDGEVEVDLLTSIDEISRKL